MYKTIVQSCETMCKMKGVIIVTILFCSWGVFVEGTISVISELEKNQTLYEVDDQPARFIPERFSFYGIQGYLILAHPEDACHRLDPPPQRSFPLLDPVIEGAVLSGPEYPINWIVLAKRSPDCHFQTKIENAQSAGYNAIIIHNVDSNSTEIMGVEDPSKIIIYATFIGEYDGHVLRNYSYDKGKPVYIRIQDDFSINSYLLPFAIVVGLCFIVMIIFMLWQQVMRFLRERRRSRRRKLPASALKKLPTQKWTKGDPYETCAVCLDDFVEQDKIRVLPCSHGFHMKCIDPWLTKGRRVCPICKRKVVVAEERTPRTPDSDSDTEDETAPLLGTSATQTSPGGEETFVQRQEHEDGSSSSSPTQEGHSSQESSPVRHRNIDMLPQVHTRGLHHPGQTARGMFSFFHSRRGQAQEGPSTSRPRPRPAFVDAETDSSSLPSSGDSSRRGSAGGGSPHRHHQSHAVLAEVHHSTELLRQRIQEDRRVNTEPRLNDDTVHVPDYAEEADGNGNEGFGPGAGLALSSRRRDLENENGTAAAVVVGIEVGEEGQELSNSNARSSTNFLV